MAAFGNLQRPGEISPDPACPEAVYTRNEPPFLELILWPNRSLSRHGFSTVLKIAAIGLALPVVSNIGNPAAWMLLPFVSAALFALWWSIRRNNHDATLTETLRLWGDLIAVERKEPDGTVKCWHANPYWVVARIHDNAKITDYLTLKGNGREIELGAFLSPEERLDLCQEIDAALSAVRLGGA